MSFDIKSITSKVSNNVGSALNSDLLTGAVENFAKEGLNAIFDNKKLDSSLLESLGAQALGNVDLGALFGGEGRNAGYMRNYASDFIAYAPKHKFLFKVEFGFDDVFSRALNVKKANQFQYLIKSIDRPKINFEYDEANMYNYKTKILRRMTYDSINMSFYDDIKNTVINFIEMYRQYMSPGADIGNPDNSTILSPSQMEELGFTIAKRDIIVENYSGEITRTFSTASTGYQKTLIKYIRLHQVYAHGSRVTTYTFWNPKIESIELDSLDYESSDGAMVNMSFAYDLLDVSDNRTFKTPGSVFGYDMVGNTNNIIARRAYKNSGDSDEFDIDLSTTPSTDDDNSIMGIIGGGIKRAIPSVLSNQANKAIQKMISKSGIKSDKIKNAIGGNVGTTVSGGIRKGVADLLGVKR